MAEESTRSWERAGERCAPRAAWRWEVVGGEDATSLAPAVASPAVVLRGTGPEGSAVLALVDAGSGRLAAARPGGDDPDLAVLGPAHAEAARGALEALRPLSWRRLLFPAAERDGAVRCALRALAWTFPYAERPAAGAGDRRAFDVAVFRPSRAGALACLLAGAVGFLRAAAARRPREAARERGEAVVLSTSP
jgi:hypothetical protein